MSDAMKLPLRERVKAAAWKVLEQSYLGGGEYFIRDPQGDPDGPTYFDAAIDAIMREIETEQSEDERDGYCDAKRHAPWCTTRRPCAYNDEPTVQAQPQDNASTEAIKYVQSVIDCADVWTEEWAQNVFIAGWRAATSQAKGHVEITDEMVKAACSAFDKEAGQMSQYDAMLGALEAALNG